MECLHQYRGSVISLRGFHATPHVVGAPCHYPLYRQKGQLKVDLTIQRAYTAQLAATDLDPYSVSLVAGYSTRAGIPSCCDGMQSRLRRVSNMILYFQQDVEYNAQRNGAFWETRPVLVARRTAEICKPSHSYHTTYLIPASLPCSSHSCIAAWHRHLMVIFN